MKATDFFPSKYLRKEDLSGPVVLTIAQVVGEMMDSDNGGKEQKAVMQFTDKRYKPMIINKGNWLALAESYGEDSEHWHGKPVELFVDPSVMFGGKRVGGLRVRVPSKTVNAEWKYPSAPAQTLEQVMVATGCAQVGVTREQIISLLKSKGYKGFDANRDTITVEILVQDAKRAAEEGFDEMEENGQPESSEVPWA